MGLRMINEKDLTLSDVINDTAQILAGRLRSQLKEIEDAGKTLKAEVAHVKDLHQKDVQYYIGEVAGLKASNKILQERVAEFLPRPPEHQHDPDEPNAVFTFDQDGTLKPQVSQGD